MSKHYKTGLGMGFITFIMAIIVVSLSRLALSFLSTILMPFIILFIISMGIIFDTIGVAAMAADEVVFNAKASRKVFGARHGLYLVRNADKVATFCNDIIGDICGTVSGSLGALLVLRLLIIEGSSETVLNLLMVAGIAAITVGGKGLCKGMGIKNANKIIESVGILLARFDKCFVHRKAKGGVCGK